MSEILLITNAQLTRGGSNSTVHTKQNKVFFFFYRGLRPSYDMKY